MRGHIFSGAIYDECSRNKVFFESPYKEIILNKILVCDKFSYHDHYTLNNGGVVTLDHFKVIQSRLPKNLRDKIYFGPIGFMGTLGD